MAKFKVGDKVIRNGGSQAYLQDGKEYIVSCILDAGYIKVKDNDREYNDDYFDIVPSPLPTDRPLTYDETQMLQAGDVVKTKSCNYTVKRVLPNIIYFMCGAKWSLGEITKSVNCNVYFVLRPEKEEKKEVSPVKELNFPLLCVPTGFSGTEVDKPIAKSVIHEWKDTKSVSEILYGRK